MSMWTEFDFGQRILDILGSVGARNHHMGNSFLTPYQIAIEFAQRFPDDFQQLEQRGYPIGGEGAGVRNSLPQYIAGELSRRIRESEFDDIEGGSISSCHMCELSFDHEQDIIRSSLTNSGYDLSLFRLRS